MTSPSRLFWSSVLLFTCRARSPYPLSTPEGEAIPADHPVRDRSSLCRPAQGGIRGVPTPSGATPSWIFLIRFAGRRVALFSPLGIAAAAAEQRSRSFKMQTRSRSAGALKTAAMPGFSLRPGRPRYIAPTNLAPPSLMRLRRDLRRRWRVSILDRLASSRRGTSPRRAILSLCRIARRHVVFFVTLLFRRVKNYILEYNNCDRNYFG